MTKHKWFEGQVDKELLARFNRLYYHQAGVTDCCGAHVLCGADCGGAQEDECKECAEPLCDKCAGYFEREDGYGDDGTGIRTQAWCKGCWAAKGAAKASSGVLRG